MAFVSRIGSVLRQTVGKNANANMELCPSNPMLYQAVRSMSKLFVGGLSYSTDEQSLEQAFSQHGRVTEARIIMDRDTGRSRGFGFVTFESLEDANKAMEAWDSQELHGRRLRVNIAADRPRPPRYDNFGGGGGGYGDGGSSGGGGYGNSGGGGYGGGGYGGGGGGYGGGGYGNSGGGGYGGGGYGNSGGGGYGGGGYGNSGGGGYGNSGGGGSFGNSSGGGGGFNGGGGGAYGGGAANFGGGSTNPSGFEADEISPAPGYGSANVDSDIDFKDDFGDEPSDFANRG